MLFFHIHTQHSTTLLAAQVDLMTDVYTGDYVNLT